MVYEFTGDPVSATYPPPAKRHYSMFMLVGISMTWDTAPTTSESVELKLEADFDEVIEPLLADRDPATDSLTSWVHLISDGPIPLIDKSKACVTYPNTDRRKIKVWFIGYWT